MPLADRQATLNDLHTTREILELIEDAKKEFPYDTLKDYDTDGIEEVLAWAKKWFGEVSGS